MKTYEVTYIGEGHEITKSIDAPSIEVACHEAANSINWPLEIKDYRGMTAEVRGSKGRVDLTNRDLYSK